MTPRNDDRRSDEEGRRSTDPVQGLVIALNTQLREELLAAHGRVRDDLSGIRADIASARLEVSEWRRSTDKRIDDVERDVTIIQTQRAMEEKQHAKQATFISMFVSIFVSGIVSAVRSWLTGKP